MPEYSRHQKKVIEGYYKNRETIMLDKLSELVSELYLAETDRQRERLWQRVAAALENLKVKKPLAAHILEKRSPEILAAHVQDWLKKTPQQ